MIRDCYAFDRHTMRQVDVDLQGSDFYGVVCGLLKNSTSDDQILGWGWVMVDAKGKFGPDNSILAVVRKVALNQGGSVFRVVVCIEGCSGHWRLHSTIRSKDGRYLIRKFLINIFPSAFI